MDDKPKSVIRATDRSAILLARGLVQKATYGAIAVIDTDGWPLASRVGVATSDNGTPIILVSGLSAHTRALANNPKCSLLLGEPGKGDPLAHPRITVICNAVKVDRSSDGNLRERYLGVHPKAKLYVDLGDFCFFRLDPVYANLNGGFGKAYHLTSEDLLGDP